MIFDKLCDIVERQFSDLIPLLQHAQVIKFDVSAHEVLDRDIPLDDAITLRDEFQMPSLIVAVEDKGGCVLLVDKNPDAVGIMQERIFIDCVPLDGANPEGFSDDNIEDLLALTKLAPPHSCIVVVGEIRPTIAKPRDWGAEVSIQRVFMGSATIPMYGPVNTPAMDPVVAGLMMQSSKNAMSALEELIELRKLHKWRMTRELPSSEFRRCRPIPRSNERVVFVPVLREEHRSPHCLPRHEG